MSHLTRKARRITLAPYTEARGEFRPALTQAPEAETDWLRQSGTPLQPERGPNSAPASLKVRTEYRQTGFHCAVHFASAPLLVFFQAV